MRWLLTVALMACKAIIVMGLSRIFGLSLSTAIQVGLLLSQGSEFAFILFSLASTQGILDGALTQVAPRDVGSIVDAHGPPSVAPSSAASEA